VRLQITTSHLSKSAPPTSYLTPSPPSTHEPRASHDLEEEESSSFIPKLVRRLSAKASAPSQVTGEHNKLHKKRRIPLSPDSNMNGYFTPLPESGYRTPAAVAHSSFASTSATSFQLSGNGKVTQPSVHCTGTRPINRRSFSLPLFIQSKRRRESKLSSESGHEADISQGSGSSENDGPEFISRTFDVLSRKPIYLPDSASNPVLSGSSAILSEVKSHVTSEKQSPLRSRVLSSPPRPSAIAVFQATPTKVVSYPHSSFLLCLTCVKYDLSRRHSSATPQLERLDSDGSIDSILQTPTSKDGHVRTSSMQDSPSPKAVLLPLAASPSSLLSEVSDIKFRSIGIPLRDSEDPFDTHTLPTIRVIEQDGDRH